MKTSGLTGPALNWAVATCEDRNPMVCKQTVWSDGGPDCDSEELNYSTDWAQGGPIIEREGIELKRGLVKPFVWAAFAYLAPRAHSCGSTPLIAAMRCYVAMKLGDEVDVPKELQ